MATNYVYGVFSDVNQAAIAVNDLIKRGMYSGDITVVANELVKEHYEGEGNFLDYEDLGQDKRNWFQRFFGMEDETDVKTVEVSVEREELYIRHVEPTEGAVDGE